MLSLTFQLGSSINVDVSFTPHILVPSAMPLPFASLSFNYLIAVLSRGFYHQVSDNYLYVREKQESVLRYVLYQ